MQFAWNAQTIGAISAASSVLLGAFGAHGLKSHLADFSVDQQAYYTDIWKTASQYHMYHSVGMILSPMVLKHCGSAAASQAWPRSAQMFATGIAFFSGSLYALVLTKAKWLGAVTPVGGLFFAAGWLAMAAGI